MRELDRRLEKLISSQQAKHCHGTWERVGSKSSCEQLSRDKNFNIEALSEGNPMVDAELISVERSVVFLVC